ncbi:MAG: protein kinase domain-containing protein [Planctomycetota bacterium]
MAGPEKDGSQQRHRSAAPYPFASGEPTASWGESGLGLGACVGPFKLLSILGEGAFGIVYLAEQSQPVRRRVALKVIKPGMDTKEVIARFEAERQAVALLNHANVAKVYEAGATEGGRAYFAMEHVQGVPITEYCDRHKLSVKERLGLFQQVCRGIHHAHLKGIIHRDLKPSNILVAAAGEGPLAKVIDFGVAKATNQRLTEKTLYTEVGRAIGTPGYMSPEQAELTAEDVDSRTDIYSLGVLLYELLTGELPLDSESLRKAGFDEIVRRIREEEPPTPSTRLRRLNLERTAKLASQRRTNPSALGHTLRGDLDWITMKALEKERERRYHAASELAADIARYLKDEPVLAGPPSNWYVLKKMLWRHRSQVAVAGAFVLVLVVAVCAIMYTLYQARNQALDRAQDLELSNYAYRIALAQNAYESRAVGRMKELLGACPVDLRGWEWHRLSFISDRSIQTVSEHSDTVTSVAFSPNANILASGSADNTVKLWNIQGATAGVADAVPVLSHLRTFSGHDGQVMSVAFTSGGRRLASASCDGTVKLWDVNTGAELLSIDHDPFDVFSVAFPPDDTQIATGGSENTIRLWDAERGAFLKELGGHVDIVYAAVFTPDGRRIVSCGGDRNVKVWDSATGDIVQTFKDHEDEVNALALIADGKHIVSGGWDFVIRMWDMSTSQEVQTLKGHEDGVKALAYSADERRIVSGSADDTIKIWDRDTGACVLTLRGHDDDVESVAVSPHGRWIASGSRDHAIKLWDADMPPDVLMLCVDPQGVNVQDEKIHAIDFSPDGRHIVSASGPAMGKSPKDNTVRIWDARTGETLKVLRDHTDTVEAVTYSPKGDKIISGSRDGTVRLWDPETCEVLGNLTGHSDRVTSVICSPDGKQIASGSWDGMIKLWNIVSGKCTKTLDGHANGVTALDYSPLGDRIVSGGRDNALTVWDPISGRLIRSLAGHGEILAVAFSPDGRRILSGSASGMLEAWDAATGDNLFSITAHTGSVMSVAFSPDGARMAAGGTEDYLVKIWNVETRDELLVLRGHSSKVSSAIFSPDGSRLASGSYDQTIRIWETNLAASEPNDR